MDAYWILNLQLKLIILSDASCILDFYFLLNFVLAFENQGSIIQAYSVGLLS